MKKTKPDQKNPEQKSESDQKISEEKSESDQKKSESKCECDLCTKKISLFDLFFGKKSETNSTDKKESSQVNETKIPDLVTETTQLRPNLIDETTSDKCITSDVINESPVVSDD